MSSGSLDFESMTRLMDEWVRTGYHIVRAVAVVFPYLCFGKKSHSWSFTEWRQDVLLKHPNGCKLEQFEASRHRGRPGRKVLVVRIEYHIIRTIIPLVRTHEAFIRKLLAAKARLFERQGTTVQTRLKNRKEFQRNPWEIDRTVVRPDGSDYCPNIAYVLSSQTLIWSLSL